MNTNRLHSFRATRIPVNPSCPQSPKPQMNACPHWSRETHFTAKQKSDHFREEGSLRAHLSQFSCVPSENETAGHGDTTNPLLRAKEPYRAVLSQLYKMQVLYNSGYFLCKITQKNQGMTPFMWSVHSKIQIRCVVFFNLQ